jgi:dolichyl-phosphate mannosyltransferase polypeptide 3
LSTSQFYLALFLGIVPTTPKIQDDIVPVVSSLWVFTNRLSYGHNTYTFALQLPFWALVSFGAYLLFKLGYGLFSFNDVPEAHKELMAQIETARKELRAKGVTID